jgi:endonuclease YncB( thermonuclease family)
LKKLLRIALLISLFSVLVSIEDVNANFWMSRVIDGDTFEVTDADGKKIQIDLAGIDAPEMPGKKKTKGQPFSRKAFQALSEMIIDKQFSYKACGETVDNHILAVVYSEGKNVNLELIKAGFAEVYRGQLPPGFDIAPYKAAEDEARKAAQGIWSLGSVYISPKTWRKANQNSF